MRLRSITEEKQTEFSYNDTIREFWRNKKIEESILKEMKDTDTAEKLLNQLIPSIRKIAYFKSRGEDRHKKYDTGLVHRFTPEDEDDLYQIGVHAVWQALANLEERGIELSDPRVSRWNSLKYNVLLSAKQSMNRGGTEDMRVIGNMPIVGSAKGMEVPYKDEDADLHALENTDADPADRDMMLQAIEKFDGNPKIKEYLRMAAQGYGPTEIGKKLNVSKVAVHNGIKRAMPIIRDLIGIDDPKQNQTLPESTCSRALQGTLKPSRQSVVLLGIPDQKAPLKLQDIATTGCNIL